MTAAAALQVSILHTATSAPPALRLVLPPPSSAPTKLDVELALPIARAQVHRLLRLGSIRVGEFEDVVQELLTDAAARWPRFDPHRAGASTFISMVMNRRACSLSRSRYAAKRRGDRRSNREDQCLLDQVPDSRSSDRRNSELERALVRQDVHAIIPRLPPQLQRLCSVLMGEGVSAAARALGIPRHVARGQVDEIRRCFVKAGFECANHRGWGERSS